MRNPRKQVYLWENSKYKINTEDKKTYHISQFQSPDSESFSFGIWILLEVKYLHRKSFTQKTKGI